jgi:lipoprotein YgeR
MDAKHWAIWMSVLSLLLAGCPPEPKEDRVARSREQWPIATHTVQRGETVSSIADKYGVSAVRIVQDNRLSHPDRIEVGQKLRVAGGRVAGVSVSEPPAVAERAEPPVRKVTGKVEPTGRFTWPLRGSIVRGYSPSSRGIAIGASPNETVTAADGGRVVLASDEMRGYGRVVMLDHGNGYTTVYANNAKLLVGEGEAVRQGQPIAKAGSTGRASQGQVEFRVYRNGVPQDPRQCLR